MALIVQMTKTINEMCFKDDYFFNNPPIYFSYKNLNMFKRAKYLMNFRFKYILFYTEIIVLNNV